VDPDVYHPELHPLVAAWFKVAATRLTDRVPC
jgi:hypothetical protein